MKPEKVKIGKCIPISKKSDYDIFEESVRKNEESNTRFGTLF
jgi:ribosomal protein S17